MQQLLSKLVHIFFTPSRHRQEDLNVIQQNPVKKPASSDEKRKFKERQQTAAIRVRAIEKLLGG